MRRRQLDARVFDLGHELRAHAGRLDRADDLAVLERLLLEQEDVLEDDLVAFHALHFGDVGDLARAVAHAALLDDHVDRRADLLADGAHGQVHAGHQHHRLQAGEHVARGVGVAGGQRAVVARVHRLEHVQRLAAAALADDDAVGPHAQALTSCSRGW